MTTRISPRFLSVAVLAVVAIVVGLLGPNHLPGSWGGASSKNLSAKDRIEAAPPPTLFTLAQAQSTASAVATQHVQAATMVRSWAAAHGSSRQDAAFTTWLEKSFPAPPANLGAEMSQVVRLKSTRTPQGVTAATWLETYGKKDIWKLYAHDQGELLASPVRTSRKDDEKTLLKLAKTISDNLGAKYGSSAPYVRMPSLRPDHKVTAGQQCPCSYPSRHATAAAASRTFLGVLDPGRVAEYTSMEAQVDFSRVYMAGHFPGDITAGALLGDVIGDYYLLTRQNVDPSRLG